ncbi:hypothetical protein TIFTF001_056187 [Ficus carica]|uniref:Uncharacterized protein n=1 Tax=Ficus carica TaxID=3494 RepID=A0AA88EIW9_FICCA|nr:hypothetical protein TIFTF001_056186 [Ficus carica]GMN74234.1 hypothetical protein TIFTF001_056187 [Ficus carica]
MALLAVLYPGLLRVQVL